METEFSKKQSIELQAFEEKQRIEREAFVAKQEREREKEARREKERQEYEAFAHSLINEAVETYDFSRKQAEVIFSRAWEEGHSCGYNEVRMCFDDLIDFLNDFINA